MKQVLTVVAVSDPGMLRPAVCVGEDAAESHSSQMSREE